MAKVVYAGYAHSPMHGTEKGLAASHAGELTATKQQQGVTPCSSGAQGTYGTIWGVVDIHELIHTPVKPAHEEDAQRESVRDQDQVGVVAEAPSIDVPHNVVLKDGHPVIDVCPVAHQTRT